MPDLKPEKTFSQWCLGMHLVSVLFEISASETSAATGKGGKCSFAQNNENLKTVFQKQCPPVLWIFREALFFIRKWYK